MYSFLISCNSLSLSGNTSPNLISPHHTLFLLFFSLLMAYHQLSSLFIPPLFTSHFSLLFFLFRFASLPFSFLKFSPLFLCAHLFNCTFVALLNFSLIPSHFLISYPVCTSLLIFLFNSLHFSFLCCYLSSSPVFYSLLLTSSPPLLWSLSLFSPLCSHLLHSPLLPSLKLSSKLVSSDFI